MGRLASPGVRSTTRRLSNERTSRQSDSPKRKEALATKRRRGPRDSSREPNCPPPQVHRLVLALPISGTPRITVAVCLGAGCRVTEIAERSQGLNVWRAEHASSEIGGRLPRKNVRWFLHWHPPKKRENTARRRLWTQSFFEDSSCCFYRLPHANQLLCFEQAIRLC